MPVDIVELSLEELLQTRVTLVSRKAEELSQAPAAAFVISREDIRRSGVTSIADAMRLVPGMQVAQIDANKWAISARGFNHRFASKLLVLIDGRSAYTPLFSGVYWEAQDVLLEDVDRIEVVRGPGATLWGANAVNGVVNIITKPAGDTQGSLVTVGSGSEDRGTVNVRHGGELGLGAYYRIYSKYLKRDSFVDASGSSTGDDWDALRGGFRLDWKREGNAFTFQGDVYENDLNQVISVAVLDSPHEQTTADNIKLSGANLLGRWEREISPTSDLALQLYYDRTKRRDLPLGEKRNTFDIDFQHRFAPVPAHELVWGGGYRFMTDRLDDSFAIHFDPRRRDSHLVSAFLQNDIDLVADRLRLVAGSKLEHNPYTGFEIQPNLRMLWNPRERHVLWGAFSRAVRTPSRAERDFRLIIDGFPLQNPSADDDPVFVAMFADRDLESELLDAYEVGYRFEPAPRLSLDVAAFYNSYDQVLSFELNSPVAETSPPHTFVPLQFGNEMSGETYGIELAGDWRPSERWRLQGSYSGLRVKLNGTGGDTEGMNPSHQGTLRSSTTLSRGWEVDWGLRYVSRLPDLDLSAYLELDARLGWKVDERVEFSIGGRNLLRDHHGEFRSQVISVLPAEVQRSGYGRMTWSF